MTQCLCTEGSQREGGTSEVEETRLSVHVVKLRKWRTKACSWESDWLVRGEKRLMESRLTEGLVIGHYLVLRERAD